MSRIVSIHSFRGGTGKSNTTANLSYLLAAAGRVVGVIDTDIQSPGIHVLLGETDHKGSTLNDYLFGKVTIDQVAVDVSANVGLPAGRLHLVPSSMELMQISRILKDGYDVGLLNQGFKDLVRNLQLDFLLIDTHPGLHEETLLSIAISDDFIVLMRPDQQDYQGTSVTVEVARRLKVRNIYIVVNKVLSYHDPEEIRRKVEKAYGCTVAAVLPLSEKIVELASGGLFARLEPDEPWSRGLKGVAELLLAEG